MDVLMQLHEGNPAGRTVFSPSLLEGAAWGCSLADFRRVHAWCVARWPADTRTPNKKAVLFQAVLSLTPDWADKAAWLLDERGYPAAVHADWTRQAAPAMGRPDAVQRLAWLRGRGLLAPPLVDSLLDGAVCAGNTAALPELLDSGATAGAMRVLGAANKGQLGVLQLLHARGSLLADGMTAAGLMYAAAQGGHVPVLDWLQATLYPAGLPPPGEHPLTPSTFNVATGSTSLPAMRWLAERGCPRNPSCWCAVGEASVEVVEYLAELGCPFGVSATRRVGVGDSRGTAGGQRGDSGGTAGGRRAVG
jgi:hypothetical protein